MILKCASNSGGACWSGFIWNAHQQDISWTYTSRMFVASLHRTGACNHLINRESGLQERQQKIVYSCQLNIDMSEANTTRYARLIWIMFLVDLSLDHSVNFYLNSMQIKVDIICSKYRIINVRWRAWPGKNATQNTIHKVILIPITLS
jgi:hypothetical protein